MDKSIFFFKQLTSAEVGAKGTHEIYIRLPNDFDHDDFFQAPLDDNNGVGEKIFLVKNLTKGHEADDDVLLRYAYFYNSNKEKRIPSLGDFFHDNNVAEGDVVRIESRIHNSKPSFYITFLKAEDIQISPRQFYYSISLDCSNSPREEKYIISSSLQQIYYGAPGTGKSYRVKCETADWEQRGRVVRTTFHPDSDYSTFVGCYKPTTQNVPRYDIYNKLVKDERNELVMEKVITYEFVPQAFLQAYIAAWTDRETPEYLIIEEINRGNCAQIFGDLFQLLDRGDDGYSEYAIRADKDLQKHLEEAFKDIKIPDYPNVKSGEELLLPANLYIRATMNTSDQSLFPIDSAFKRRWDWQYVPIARAEGKDWKIEADGKQYDWWSFLEEINKIVFTTTNSEDKQLGFYFCKANKDGVISADTFVSKVIFYLWSDVFKDFGFDDQIFKDADGEGKLSFDKFYNGKGEVIDGKVVGFLTNLKLDPVAKENDSIIEEEEEYEEDEEEDTDDVVSTAHDHSMYSINGEGRYIKRHIAAEVMKRYVVANPDYPEEQIAKEWAQLYSPMGTFVYTAGGYNDFINAPGGKEESRKIRYIPVDLPSGGKVYVSNQFTKEKVELFNESLKSLKWPYEIKRISE